MVEVVVVMGIAWFNMGSRVNDLEYWGAAHQSIYCHSALDSLPWAKVLSGGVWLLWLLWRRII